MRLGLWALATLLLGSACGGSSNSDDGKCANGVACGGAIAGAWKISGTCLTVDLAAMSSTSCPEQTAEASDLEMTGNVTYGADSTYTSNVTTSLKVVVTQPKSCLVKQGITLTCEQLQQGIEAQLDSTAFTSVGCAASAGGGCSCTFVAAPQTTSAAGTYTTTGAGLLTQTPTGDAPDDSDYCAKGSTLTLSPHGDSSMGMGTSMTTISGTITLTKQ